MPPQTPLDKEQVQSLASWVQEGLAWPDDLSGSAGTGSLLWSLKAVEDHEAPLVERRDWPRSSIDHFILQQLEENQLEPSPQASKEVLLRRACFDLIGLPPTPEQLRTFLADDTPNAFAKVVDALLASPHYGERWGRHWLDLVRFAESNGFEFDLPKPNAYRYRDYVVEAFNHDLPYDVFLKETLAGDLLSPGRVSADGSMEMTSQATAAMWFQEMIEFVVDQPKARADELENQIDTLGKSLLGLTLACARCHDHKFDPITAADYYSLAGVFMSSTNVQACVDSAAQTQRIVDIQQEIATVRRREQEILNSLRASAALASARFQAAQQIKRYLAAAREALLIDEQQRSARLAAIARRHSVTTERLERWIALLQPAEPPRDSVFQAWWRLAHCPSTVVNYRRRTLAGIFERENLRHPWFGKPRGQVWADFEGANFDGWTAVGHAFGKAPQRPADLGIRGFHGRGIASSFGGSNALTGRLVSPKFKLGSSPLGLVFRIAGRRNPQKTCVNVLDNSQSLVIHETFSVTANDSPQFCFHLLPLSPLPFPDREIFVEVVDDDEAGHIMVDDFQFIELGDYLQETRHAAFMATNPLVIEMLRDDRLTTHAAIDDSYQAAILAALAQYQHDLDAQLATSSSDPLQPEWWQALRARTPDTAHAEFLDVVLRSDSPLLNQDECEQLLDDEQRVELATLRDKIAQLEAHLPHSAFAIVAAEAREQDAAIQLRGDPSRPGAVVERGYVTALRPAGAGSVTTGSGRLEMANWIAAAQNPLTARVMVNRIWQHHFGRGLVATVDDFGTRGDLPTHPELLDHLAAQFVECGWSVKEMHRRMMLSATYQQDSRPSSAGAAKDPANRLLAHMPIRRLEAECIRDAILQAAGTLDGKLGGPSVAVVNEATATTAAADSGSAPQAERRSIYLEVRRNQLDSFLAVFDFPRPDMCTGQRATQIVPEQSLALLNHPFVHRHALQWGRAIARQAGRDQDQIVDMYLRALGRSPTAEELSTGTEFLAAQAEKYRAFEQHANEAQARAWADLAHVIFNMTEFEFVR